MIFMRELELMLLVLLVAAVAAAVEYQQLEDLLVVEME
jgi:hypothetical protein